MSSIAFSILLGCFELLDLQGIAAAQPYEVRTIAGSAINPGYADGTNSEAQFISPTGVAVAPSGTVYIADGNAIRSVTGSASNWVVHTIAGIITSHGPNDGTNSIAQFDAPQEIAVDQWGTIYVADTLNNAIRKVVQVGTNWVVTTIAGLAGRSTFGSANGTNSTARFHNPYGIAVDANTNVYVSDTLNSTIRRLTEAGTNWVVSTVAGLANFPGNANGSNDVARFNNPAGLAVDTAGNVYVADFANHTIRKLAASGTNWVVTTAAGAAGIAGSADGDAGSARFRQPQSVCVDSAGNLYIVDSGNYTLRKLGSSGLVSTLAGTPGKAGWSDGVGGAALFMQPYGIGLDSNGRLFVADYLGYSLRLATLAPLLQYRRSGGQTVLSWPAALTGFQAEGTTTLSPASWYALPSNSVSFSNDFYSTAITNSGPVFYRLHKVMP